MITRAFLSFALILLSLPGQAQLRRQSLIQYLDEQSAEDSRIPAAARGAMLKAIETRFAARGREEINVARLPAAQTALAVMSAGCERGADPAHIAEVSWTAHDAVLQGAPARLAKGIAVYALHQGVSTSDILSWSRGHAQLTARKVPPEVAAEVVRNAMSGGWDEKTFTAVKRGLMDAAKSGFELRAYSSLVFARMLQDKSNPGAVLADAMDRFAKARASGQQPELPAYQGLFEPFVRPGEDKFMGLTETAVRGRGKPDELKPDASGLTETAVRGRGKPDEVKPDASGLIEGGRRPKD